MTIYVHFVQAPAQQYPVDSSSVGPAQRLRTVIDKQDDFSQAGARYRYYDSARQVTPPPHLITFIIPPRQ